MADKEKRFRKILSKKCLKGKLKLVDTSEQSHFVLLYRRGQLFFIKKEDYLTLIRRGKQFTEEEVYFAVSPNPRDSKHIEEKYLTNSFGNMQC